MFGFYKKHVDFIAEHAVDPDKRRYSIKGEAPRHYIDIDHYAKEGENPFELVPENWFDAKEKYSEDTLLAYGVLPWHLNLMMHQLTEAFKNKDAKKILRLSTDMGHYLGDAHVPLHTTKNYNGQLTNQVGIHGFWESRIPELSADNYQYFVGKAEYIEKVDEFIWQIIQDSHWAVDSVLRFERELTEAFESDRKYSFENRGAQVIQVYSEDFSLAFEKKLNGMVEKRMLAAVKNLGSLWYTAWVNAGQPPLNSVSFQSESEEDSKEQEELNQKFSLGKIFGREHGK
ncbi:MAG: zinc dependent phospholipase C family protein [Bacteroidota bacterium]